MLRCPKCSRIYQSGANRFCTHDGGRLLTIAAESGNNQTNGESANFAALPNESPMDWQPRRQTGRLVLPPQIELAQNGFAKPKAVTNELPPLNPQIANSFQSNAAAAATFNQQRPTGRLVLPSEIPDSYAPTGNRSIHPTGRLPLTPRNTTALLGQNVKGRYAVDKVLQQDESSVTYLAHDRLGEYRQVMIKIWLDEFPPEAEETKRFYEERGALSHLNHPNIARILDTGELTEGNPFVITESPEGLTLREAMQISGEFSAARTARIVRQVAQALTEAHSNRLVHRNLKPENIVLKNDGGVEQVKVINFGIVGDETTKPESLAYIAPERFIGDLSHLEGDIFALGVVAFEMLTARKPFKGTTEEELLDAEELGLAVKTTNLRLDLQSSVDAVLERALAFDRADRFHHAREFGEALHNALNESALHKPFVQPIIQNEASSAPILNENLPDSVEAPKEENVISPVSNVESEWVIKTDSPQPVAPPVKTVLKEKSPKRNSKWILAAFGIIFAAALVGALIFGRDLFNRQAGQPAFVQPSEQPNNELTKAPVQTQPSPEAQPPIAPRQLSVIPPNFVRFENSKANLDGKLAENFVPFSLSYPQSWQRNPNAGKPGAANFLDVSNRVSNGLPLEQLLVSWYQSKGTFAADRASFRNLAKKLTAVYAKEIPAFRTISEGSTAINGQEAYEVRFTGKTKDEKGEAIEIFGRTIFVPANQEKAKSGLTLTMLATNLSPEIARIGDVGEKGDLKEILNTFELGGTQIQQR